jgi:hypothetical protein
MRTDRAGDDGHDGRDGRTQPLTVGRASDSQVAATVQHAEAKDEEPTQDPQKERVTTDGGDQPRSEAERDRLTSPSVTVDDANVIEYDAIDVAELDR